MLAPAPSAGAVKRDGFLKHRARQVHMLVMQRAHGISTFRPVATQVLPQCHAGLSTETRIGPSGTPSDDDILGNRVRAIAGGNSASDQAAGLEGERDVVPSVRRSVELKTNGVVLPVPMQEAAAKAGAVTWRVITPFLP